MSRQPLQSRQSPGQRSPWSVGARLRAMAWEIAWTLLCAWTPKPANPWRLVVLRVFGMTIHGTPFVHQRARIQLPWNVELHDLACVGDRASLYSLDRIVLGANCIVAQEAYLCCGTHDASDPQWPLLAAPIRVGERAFVGARAFVLPGVTIGERAVVGAGSVVTRDVPAGTTVAGNPARELSARR
jgi:putative colanic acid biosynthesis acetyltransferase WcaF